MKQKIFVAAPLSEPPGYGPLHVVRSELDWNKVGMRHPDYRWLWGPFRTLRAARLAAETYPNPHIATVADAERIAKEQQS